MMSSFRSAAAETVENPMSFVEPSPPHTTTCVSPRPRWRNADLIPDASAAADANGASDTEMPNDVKGQAPVMIDQHEAGTTRTIFRSGVAAFSALRKWRMWIAGPQ